MTAAITIDGLGKRYALNGSGTASYRTVRESLAAAVRAPFRRRSEKAGEFWALQNVSFDVRPGEVVGLIGRNGAGKSTLLKILSRITKPTSGRVELAGRVGSLLEVGTGFHPELTGRENVYLNGSILGMGRTEIARKFDAIAAFAEVERFLDTPVKRYSSGMYTRLAFAVAAHLEPEILIVDEVLAVGDQAFQQKCLGKMSEFAGSGRTVLFVSHQMSAVQALCTHAVLLDRGRVKASGEKGRVIAEYLADARSGPPAGEWATLPPRPGGRARFAAVRYGSGVKAASGRPFADGSVAFDVRVTASMAVPVAYLGVTLCDRYDTPLVRCDTVRLPRPLRLAPGENEFTLRVDALHLNPGRYRLDLWLADPTDVLDAVPGATEVEVSEYSERADANPGGVAGAVTNTFTVAGPGGFVAGTPGSGGWR